MAGSRNPPAAALRARDRPRATWTGKTGRGRTQPRAHPGPGRTPIPGLVPATSLVRSFALPQYPTGSPFDPSARDTPLPPAALNAPAPPLGSDARDAPRPQRYSIPHRLPPPLILAPNAPLTRPHFLAPTHAPCATDRGEAGH